MLILMSLIKNRMRVLILVIAILFCGCNTQKNANKYYNSGVKKETRGNYDSAIVDYNHAIEINPNFIEAYVNRGRAKGRLSDYKGAVSDFNKVLEINPEESFAWNNRGICKYELGDYSGSLADAEVALRINHGNAEAYNTRGNAKYKLGDFSGACIDWSKAAELGFTQAYAIIRKNCNNFIKMKDYLSYSTYVDGYGFSFYLPKGCKNITDDELGRLLKEANPNLCYIAEVSFSFGNELFGVSCYNKGKEINIDTAFLETVKHIATLPNEPAENYKVVNYGIRKYDEKVLRFKISCVKDSVYSIMYYFMKDNYSRFLYEMKLTCRKHNDLKTTQNYLEKIALTANYDSH
jgi:tetratricopeptide (TPR) repeat protein